MKVIIAGSRNIDSMYIVKQAVIESGFYIEEVVCGGARGVDSVGRKWAEGLEIPVKMFPADWKKFGRYAGIHRNIEMAQYADALIAVWDGKSRGTENMIVAAKAYGLKVFVKNFINS